MSINDIAVGLWFFCPVAFAFSLNLLKFAYCYLMNLKIGLQKHAIYFYLNIYSMKKLLLSLACAAMALGANATLYVVGAGDGLTWDLPGKAYEAGADGKYVLNIKNLTKFKASTANTIDWDVYNTSAYATGKNSFTSAGVYPQGQTLPIEVWGEDQELPYTSDYIITIDLNGMTMTAKAATAPSTDAPAVYVRGDMNGWGSPDSWKFTNVSWNSSTNTGEYTLDCKIPAGQTFKIADANWGTINYGGNTNLAVNTEIPLVPSGGNMSLASAFEGTIRFKITGAKTASVFFEMQGEAKDPEQFYVIGTLAQGAWNPTVGVIMKSNGSGIYTAEEVTLIENDGSTGFAICANLGTSESDWGTVNGLRFGPSVTDTPAVLGTNTDVAMGDLTWSFTPGTYKMVFNYIEKTLTVSTVGGGTGPVEPDPERTDVYVIGTIVGNVWNPESSPKMSDEGDGIYSLDNVKIQAADGSQVGYLALCTRLGSWDIVNANRMGPKSSGTASTEGENPVDGKGDVSWTINPGVYNLVFDMTEMCLDIEYVGVLDPDEPVGPDPDAPVKASVIYVVGAGEGLSWDLPGKAIQGTDNVFTFTVNNLVKFKASVNNTTEWDNAGGFNDGAYATGSASFTEAGVYPSGQTLPIMSWAEDQEVPYVGDYTITIDFNKMTMTALALTAPSAEAPAVYIRGGMNNWLNDGVNDAWKFNYDTAKDEYTINCIIPSGVDFKIADANWGSINYGYGEISLSETEVTTVDLAYNSDKNITLSSQFEGVVIFRITGEKQANASFVPKGVEQPDDAVVAIEATEGEAVFYNLQGQRVNNPESGIFIKVQNGRALKVVK